MTPTVHVMAVEHLRAMLARLGVDADLVLQRVGLGGPAAGERVSRGAYLEAKAEASRRAGDPHLGLRLGLMSRLDAFGLFGAALSHARTVREALQRGREAAELWEQGTEIRVEAHEGGARIHYRNLHGRALAQRVDGDHTIVFLARVVREVTAAPPEELALSLASEPPDDAALRESLRAVGRVRFGAPTWSLGLTDHTLDRTLWPTHPAARRVLDQEIGRALQTLSADTDLVARLDAVLRHRIEGPCALRAIAAELGVSPRSLQQQLEARGTTFGTERDRVREAVARELLHGGALRVSEVARRVGFASTPGFSRFFRRRTGAAASRLRDGDD